MAYNNSYANDIFWKNFNNGANMVNASQSYASSGAGNNFFNQQKARANSANLANNNFIRLGAMSYNASQDPYSQSLNQPLNNGNANSLADNQFISKFGNMQQNATNSANARYDMNALSPLYNVGRGNYTSTYQNLQPLASQAMTPRERMYAMGDWAMGTLQAEKDMMNQNMLNKWNATMAHNLIGDREKAYQNDLTAQQKYYDSINDEAYRTASLTNQMLENELDREYKNRQFDYNANRDTLADTRLAQANEQAMLDKEAQANSEKQKQLVKFVTDAYKANMTAEQINAVAKLLYGIELGLRSE